MEINREALKSSGRIRKRKIFRALSLTALCFAAALALTSWLFHLDGLYIKTIFIRGNQQVDTGRIFGIVSRELQGRYYWLYPESNILIYPKTAITESLLREIPTLASAVISNGTNSLFVDVQERTPKYLWCDDASKPMLDRVCYYLDAGGFAFNRAPSFSTHVYPEFYGGDRRGGYVGRAVLPADILRAVRGVRDFAEGATAGRRLLLGRPYGVYIYPDTGDYDILFSGGSRDWRATFNLDTQSLAADEQNAEKKFGAIIVSPFFLKELDAPGKHLEYIDLRFGQKVFYKFDSGV